VRKDSKNLTYPLDVSPGYMHREGIVGTVPDKRANCELEFDYEL